MHQPLPDYTTPSYVRFVEDMLAAGLPVQHYNGRWYYSGPAVVTDRENGPTENEVYRATTVSLRRDSMGFDTVLYPG